MQTGRVTPSAPVGSFPAEVGAGGHSAPGWSSPWDWRCQGQIHQLVARGVYGGLGCVSPKRDEFTVCRWVGLFLRQRQWIHHSGHGQARGWGDVTAEERGRGHMGHMGHGASQGRCLVPAAPAPSP